MEHRIQIRNVRWIFNLHQDTVNAQKIRSNILETFIFSQGEFSTRSITTDNSSTSPVANALAEFGPTVIDAPLENSTMPYSQGTNVGNRARDAAVSSFDHQII